MKDIDPEIAFGDLGNELRKLGISDHQLHSIRFSKKYRDRPLDEWVMTFAPDLPLEAMPNVWSKVRQYATLKFALVDGPAEDSPHVLAALAQISNDRIAFMAADHLAYLGRQKKASKAPRNFIPEIGMTMREFVVQYAKLGDNRLLQAHDLWDGFGSHFRFEARLDITLIGKTYKYCDGRTLSYATFRNYVAERDRAKSH